MIFFFTSFITLFENIVCEYLLVLKTKKDNENLVVKTANNLPIYFAARACGFILGSFFSGRIIDHFSIEESFMLTSQIAFVVLLIILFYKDQFDHDAVGQRKFLEEMKTIG